MKIKFKHMTAIALIISLIMAFSVSAQTEGEISSSQNEVSESTDTDNSSEGNISDSDESDEEESLPGETDEVTDKDSNEELTGKTNGEEAGQDGINNEENVDINEDKNNMNNEENISKEDKKEQEEDKIENGVNNDIIENENKDDLHQDEMLEKTEENNVLENMDILLAPMTLELPKEESFTLVSREGATLYINGVVAYCYNQLSPMPADGMHFQQGVPYTGQQGHENDREVIEGVLTAGYPFDAFGYMDKYLGSYDDKEEKAHAFTQQTLWIVLRGGDIEKALSGLPFANLDENLKDYMRSIYNAGAEGLKPSYGNLELDSKETAIPLAVNESEGYYVSDMVHITGWEGEILLTLPKGVKAYNEGGEEITKVMGAEGFTLTADKDTDASGNVKAKYTYKYPTQFMFYAPPLGTNYQNLISSEVGTGVIEASFEMELPAWPTPDPDPTPTPTPTPEPDEEPTYHGTKKEPSGDTKTTTEIEDKEVPLAPAPEVTIADEEVPLAPAPEISEEIVEIEEEEVPLADTPVEIDKDIPQTGDSRAIGMYGMAALASMAAIAMMLYKKESEEK